MNVIKQSKVFIFFFAIFLLFGCSQDNQNLQVEKSGYVNVKCGKLFYKRFGSGEPIVVLHGGPGLDHNYLLPQLLELSKDYELIFYDQRGSGKSLDAKIDSYYVNLDRFSDDLEELRLALNLKKITVIGHCFGGTFAAYYAIKYPESISSLILWDCAPVDYNGSQKFVNDAAKRWKHIEDKISPLFKYEELEKSSSEQINKMFEMAFSTYFYDPKNVKFLTLKMSKASHMSGFKVSEEMDKTVWLNPKFNLFPSLKNLQIPTLIIHAKQDVFPISTARDLENTIPKSKAVYLDRCGHFSYIEKADEVFKAIRSFLSDKRK